MFPAGHDLISALCRAPRSLAGPDPAGESLLYKHQDVVRSALKLRVSKLAKVCAFLKSELETTLLPLPLPLLLFFFPFFFPSFLTAGYRDICSQKKVSGISFVLDSKQAW